MTGAGTLPPPAAVPRASPEPRAGVLFRESGVHEQSRPRALCESRRSQASGPHSLPTLYLGNFSLSSSENPLTVSNLFCIPQEEKLSSGNICKRKLSKRL